MNPSRDSSVPFAAVQTPWSLGLVSSASVTRCWVGTCSVAKVTTNKYHLWPEAWKPHLGSARNLAAFSSTSWCLPPYVVGPLLTSWFQWPVVQMCGLFKWCPALQITCSTCMTLNQQHLIHPPGPVRNVGSQAPSPDTKSETVAQQPMV